MRFPGLEADTEKLCRDLGLDACGGNQREEFALCRTNHVAVVDRA